MDAQAITEKEETKLKKERRALLAQVDAIEEYLNMPRTSEMREFAKERGFYERVVDKPKI